jgi:hypothetical protein
MLAFDCFASFLLPPLFTLSTSAIIHKASKLLQGEEQKQVGGREERINPSITTEEGQGKAMFENMINTAAAFIAPHGRIWHSKDLQERLLSVVMLAAERYHACTSVPLIEGSRRERDEDANRDGDGDGSIGRGAQQGGGDGKEGCARGQYSKGTKQGDKKCRGKSGEEHPKGSKKFSNVESVKGVEGVAGCQSHGVVGAKPGPSGTSYSAAVENQEKPTCSNLRKKRAAGVNILHSGSLEVCSTWFRKRLLNSVRPAR